MPDLEVVRDLLEFDLELAGSHQGPIPVITSPPEKTWIWSDLHLGDRSVLFAFDRPFHDVDRMNGGAAYGSDDTIICLGDVAHPDAWDDRRLVLDIQNCPASECSSSGTTTWTARRCARRASRRSTRWRCAPPTRRWF